MNTVTGKDWFDWEKKSILMLVQEHTLNSVFPKFKGCLLGSASPNSSGGRSLQFGCELDQPLKYDGSSYRFYLSINMVLKENCDSLDDSSCSVVIADEATKKICRRFHLDYEHLKNANRDKEPKPSFHHQQFGKLRDNVFEGYCREAYNASFPGFEKPRLLSLPMPFLAIVHWIFKEFAPWNQNLNSIIASKKWIEAVRMAETNLMLPHLKNWAQYCENPDFERDGSECKTFVDRLYLIP